jgi:Ca2+-binding EF-hand superfamily protein
VAVILGIVVLFASTALAQGTNPNPGGGPPGGHRGGGKGFGKMDANGDGVIDKTEFPGPDHIFDKLDKDGDGKLTKDELRAGRRGRRRRGGHGPGGKGGRGRGGKGGRGHGRRGGRRFAKFFDANGDGTLDDTEKAALKKFMDDRKADMLKKYDTDGDGKLSRDEWKAARKAHHDDMVKKYDTDGDGKLSRDERKKAWEDIVNQWKANNP